MMAVTALACSEITVLTPEGTPASIVVEPEATDDSALPTVERFSFPTISAPTEIPATPVDPSVTFTGSVEIFPGPEIYAGDLLTLEAGVSNLPEEGLQVSMTVDGEPIASPAAIPYLSPWEDAFLILFSFWDTTGKEGWHRITLALSDAPEEVFSFDIEVLPPGQMDALESKAEWVEIERYCCRFFTPTFTPATRDITTLTQMAEQGLREVEETLGRGVYPIPIPVFITSVVWGNGGFASQGAGITITYTDRNFSPADANMLLKHEMTHWALFPLQQGVPMILVEGAATYTAGGHYKPEPIPRRSAALLQSGQYIALGELADHFRDHQHDIAYLEAAGLVAYLVETHGMPAFIEIYASQNNGQSPSEWLDRAFERYLSQSLGEVESDFIAWLEQMNPEEQIEDLAVTIALNDTTRFYQELHAPFQQSLTLYQSAISESPVAPFIRRTQDPASIALELMLAAAQRALREGDYAMAMLLNDSVREAMETGDFSAEPVSNHLALTEAIIAQGDIPLSVSFDDEGATCIIRNEDDLTRYTERYMIGVDGAWMPMYP